MIGYGGEHSDESDSEEPCTPSDPNDNASIVQLLEKCSNTSEEKELIRLTQKNTNFNSIKTNLLGTTCIEIGPIVGCTGGKSMQNTSKPLVSIGTFESRREPLKISKLVDGDTPDANPEVVECGRKFVPRDSVGDIKTSIKSSKIPSDTLRMKHETESKTSNACKLVSEQHKSVSSHPGVVKNSSSGITSSDEKKSVAFDASKKEALKTNVNATMTSVNSEKNFKKNSKPSGDIVTTSGSKSVPKENVPIKISTVKVDNSANRIHSRVSVMPATTNSPKPPISTEKPTNRLKPALKTTNGMTAESKNGSCLSNLIIMTDGNNITTRRTAFLKNIINVEEPRDNSLENDSLESQTNELVTNKQVQISCTGSTKAPEPSLGSEYQFDDSLEDSGVELGKSTEKQEKESDSDEKSASGSDSGNENDYSDSGACTNNGKNAKKDESNPEAREACNNNTNNNNNNNETEKTIRKSGLFISVEEEISGLKKPQKLSPDSVLCTSPSESSGSGSAESIPEAVQKADDKNNSEFGKNGSKRQAPQPPQENVICGEEEESYSNVKSCQYIADDEDLYDDVGLYRAQQEHHIEDMMEEENIYDDAMALRSNATGKTVSGSYDFSDSSRVGLDTDGDNEEGHLPNSSSGVEFIGIRKIDSETFLRERSLSPVNSSNGKKERSSSASPKARRKVKQFFSTIGKKAGAAYGSAANAYHNYSEGMNSRSNKNVPSSKPLSETARRSISTDEMNMTRTQEIYATTTPTSMKLKGLAPVLQKLSRMDISMHSGGTLDRSDSSDGDKMFRKKKITSSIKKFLKFGGTVRDSSYKYDDYGSSFGSKKTDNGYSSGSNGIQRSNSCSPTGLSEEPSSIPSSSGVSEESSSAISHSRSESTSSSSSSAMLKSLTSTTSSGRTSSCMLGRPPPPPPRVHSLDLLNKVGLMSGPGGGNNNGVVNRPLRPPPPVRANKVAPSFTSVFSQHPSTGAEISSTPPCKPLRKASMNGGSKDLESSYNHITNLNLETLRIIASQTPVSHVFKYLICLVAVSST